MARKIILPIAGNRRLRALALAGTMSLAGLIQGGCGIPPEMGATDRPPNFFIADDTVVSRDLNFLAGSSALSPTAEDQLATFVEQIDPRARDEVTVIGYGPLGLSRANGVARTLRHLGVEGVQVAEVHGDGDRVTVAVARTVHLPTACLMPSQMRPIDGFPYLPPASCANEYNLAGMVADPADLERGRTLGPAEGRVFGDAVRRHRTGAILPFETQGTGSE